MDPGVKKKTLRLLSNGMYVLTSCSGEQFGAATVTWLSQASFKPPLLMAAVRRDSNVYKCMSQSGVAAVHILTRDQQEIAQKFFAPTRADSGMMNGECYAPGKTSAPILEEAPAYLECRVKQLLETGGDHGLVILEVVEAVCRQPDIRPLTIAESPWEYGG